jgi:hypothetical protein
LYSDIAAINGSFPSSGITRSQLENGLESLHKYQNCPTDAIALQLTLLSNWQVKRSPMVDACATSKL